MGDCDIFREELGIRHPDLGHILWNPDPEGLYNSVEVGDVGFIRRGYFYRLFNAFLPRVPLSTPPSTPPPSDPPSDPDTRDDHGPVYPPRLELRTPQHIRRGRDNRKDFRSKNVSKEHFGPGHNIQASGPDDDAQVTVSCSGRQGALLSLPFPAACEDTVAQGDFGKWLVKNIDCCMRVAEDLGLGVNRMEDIILVTGRHLARSSVSVVFSESRVGAQLSFVVRVSGDSGVYLEERSATGGDLKLGPCGENLPENQCVFIRGYRVARILNIWPRLRALAEPSSDIHEPEPAHLELLSIPAETNDPLHVLLKYIAERSPDCDMALVHDDDLKLFVDERLETGLPDALLEHLRNYAPTIRQVQCETLPGNEEGSGTRTEIASVATLSDALFEQPYNDQTSSLTGFETSSQQAENLAQGDNLNLAISGYDMYTDGYIARTFGVLTTTEYMTRVFGDAKSSLRPIFAREWPDAFFIAEHYMTNTHPSVYISDQLACLVDYVVRNHGAVVPQRMWSPSHPSDTRRYVMHEPLNMPIFFVKDDRRTLGLRVVAAAAGDCMGLLSARATAPVGSLHATTLRIMWPGYREWSTQIILKGPRDQNMVRSTITLGVLSKRVAHAVCKFLEDAERQICQSLSWRVGGSGGITGNDIFLIGLIHVSQGSWQPILQLNHHVIE